MTVSLFGDVLDPGLVEVIERVAVSPDGLRATIGGRELAAETGRELRQKLISAVYETYHVGHVFDELPRAFRDRHFEDRLATCVPHSRTPAPATVQSYDDSGASRISLVDGLRVRITPREDTRCCAPLRPMLLPSARTSSKSDQRVASSSAMLMRCRSRWHALASATRENRDDATPTPGLQTIEVRVNNVPMAVPHLGVGRLLLVGTGAVHVSLLPTWLNWLRMSYPSLSVRTVITRSAQRFVSRPALSAIGGREVLLDAWPEEEVVSALHVELAEWAEAVAVYPATLHFVSRFALGLTDTPVQLALQCTAVPVAVSPALPPGGRDSAVLRGHLETLASRPNVAVIPTVPGRSVTTGREDGGSPPPLPLVLQQLERTRTEQENARE
jgi:phosphopantothenoylcysteine decarboxylase/phosphopantothenate--cysteine ligase